MPESLAPPPLGGVAQLPALLASIADASLCTQPYVAYQALPTQGGSVRLPPAAVLQHALSLLFFLFRVSLPPHEQPSQRPHVKCRPLGLDSSIEM